VLETFFPDFNRTPSFAAPCKVNHGVTLSNPVIIARLSDVNYSSSKHKVNSFFSKSTGYFVKRGAWFPAALSNPFLDFSKRSRYLAYHTDRWGFLMARSRCQVVFTFAFGTV
jgi:hypothetical protein